MGDQQSVQSLKRPSRKANFAKRRETPQPSTFDGIQEDNTESSEETKTLGECESDPLKTEAVKIQSEVWATSSPSTATPSSCRTWQSSCPAAACSTAPRFMRYRPSALLSAAPARSQFSSPPINHSSTR